MPEEEQSEDDFLGDWRRLRQNHPEGSPGISKLLLDVFAHQEIVNGFENISELSSDQEESLRLALVDPLTAVLVDTGPHPSKEWSAEEKFDIFCSLSEDPFCLIFLQDWILSIIPPAIQNLDFRDLKELPPVDILGTGEMPLHYSRFTELLLTLDYWISHIINSTSTGSENNVIINVYMNRLKIRWKYPILTFKIYATYEYLKALEKNEDGNFTLYIPNRIWDLVDAGFKDLSTTTEHILDSFVKMGATPEQFITLHRETIVPFSVLGPNAHPVWEGMIREKYMPHIQNSHIVLNRINNHYLDPLIVEQYLASAIHFGEHSLYGVVFMTNNYELMSVDKSDHRKKMENRTKAVGDLYTQAAQYIESSNLGDVPAGVLEGSATVEEKIIFFEERANYAYDLLKDFRNQ